MREMINVLDVNIEHCSAKQALKAAVEYMDTPATSVIDLVTIEALMYARDDYSYREAIDRAIWYFRGRRISWKRQVSQIPEVCARSSHRHSCACG